MASGKVRQKALDKKPSRLNAKKRPQYLLSGLLTCGSCGGGYSKINSERYDEPPRPLLHPTMANRYRQEIAALKESFANGSGGEAREHLRGSIERITLTPKSDEDDGLQVDLYGDLAGILTMATHNEKRLERKAINDNCSFKPSVQLVAGAGFEPATFGL